MRIKGHDAANIRDHTTVTLPRRAGQPITLKLYALPSSYMDAAEREIPSPQPPQLGPLRDRKGRPEFDAATGRAIILYNDRDPKYQADLGAAKVLQTFKMIVDSLDPDQVQFSAKKDADPKAYYEACRREMDELGFGLADYQVLAKAVAELSALSSDDVKVAESDFLPEELTADVN